MTYLALDTKNGPVPFDSLKEALKTIHHARTYHPDSQLKLYELVPVPHLKERIAHMNGAKIEWSRLSEDRWYPCISPNWGSDVKYRVKPGPKTPTCAVKMGKYKTIDGVNITVYSVIELFSDESHAWAVAHLDNDIIVKIKQDGSSLIGQLDLSTWGPLT
jgi:hypothetical protein